jgi:LysM repeat protein
MQTWSRLSVMRLRVVFLTLSLAALALPASASAAFVHVVAPGESLFSIAATDGLSVDQLAAANGLSPSAQLIAGSDLQIPPQAIAFAPVAATTVPASAVTSTAAPSTGDGDADSDDVGAATTPAVATATAPSTTSSMGSGGSAYVVQPGDTLWALAQRIGVPVAALAQANGLSSTSYLISGSVLHLSGSGSGTALPVSTTTSGAPVSSQPIGAAAKGDPTGPPYPTPERMSASQIGQIGAANGATASLADAIAWQESGFNNDLVSSADARGIMQITPGTWAWIQRSLDTGTPLAPASAADNVRGGSIMLNWLLRQTGGDPAMAAAGYYQGLSSVQRNGMFSDTQQYVQSVMALRQRFGGTG